MAQFRVYYSNGETTVVTEVEAQQLRESPYGKNLTFEAIETAPSPAGATTATRLADLIAEVTRDNGAYVAVIRIAGFIRPHLNATDAETEAIEKALYAWVRSVHTGWVEL